MPLRKLLICFIILVPMDTVACGSPLSEFKLGPDYIAELSNSKDRKTSDDKLDFIDTYPESTIKEELKRMFISTSDDKFYISRISYHENENMLFFVGFQVIETCAGISAYMRRLDASNLFNRINWSKNNVINIGSESRHEFGIELWLK